MLNCWLRPRKYCELDAWFYIFSIWSCGSLGTRYLEQTTVFCVGYNNDNVYLVITPLWHYKVTSVNDMIVAKPLSKSRWTHCQLDTWKHSSIWFEYKSHSFIEKHRPHWHCLCLNELTLARIMDCCLMTPNHNLHQCWLCIWKFLCIFHCKCAR